MADAAAKATWQEVAKNDQSRPDLPRSGHSAAALPEEHDADIIAFGGYIEAPSKERRACHDTWVFSVEQRAWRRLDTSGGPPRVRLAAQAVRVGWLLYVIGGWDPGFKRDGGEFLSDVWVLDLKSAEWRQAQLSPQGEQLAPISRFQAVAVGSDIYIHTHRNTHDILRLRTSPSPGDLRLGVLPVKTPQGAPSSRGLHSLTAVGSKLFLFGGAPKSGSMLDDLWELDLGAAELTWKPLSPAGRKPHARCSHTAVAVGTDIVFHGGSYYRDDGAGLQPLDDTFILDTAANEWRWPSVSDAKPLPRNAATMNAAGQTLVLHGGWKPFVETYNDTWLLNIK